MNINLLSLSNNKKSSHLCVKYGGKDVYTAGKSANCDLTPNWAQFISVAGQRLYTIQRRRPISAIGIADDIAVWGENEEIHNKNLHHLLQVSRKHGLVYNPTKCEIKVKQFKFFGSYYDEEGIHPDPDKVDDIHNMPPPLNVVQLQQFLGLVQYMSPFIMKLAKHTETLRNLVCKTSEWDWTKSHQKTFETVKSLISKECTLTYFNTQEASVIQVDASAKGLGAVLLQNGKPGAFASKALTDTETRYANIERELLAVVFGCTRFHTYIYGKKFTVESDHKHDNPLQNIQHKSLANTPPRLQRMMLRIQPYECSINYKPGSEMVLADALSRLNPRPGPKIDLDQTIHMVKFSTQKANKLKEMVTQDVSLNALREIISVGWPDTVGYMRCPNIYVIIGHVDTS